MSAVKIALVLLLILLLVLASGCYSTYRKAQPEYCEKITFQENKDACYRSVASTLRDESLCEKILDTNQKDLCYIDLAMGYRQYYYD